MKRMNRNQGGLLLLGGGTIGTLNLNLDQNNEPTSNSDSTSLLSDEELKMAFADASPTGQQEEQTCPLEKVLLNTKDAFKEQKNLKINLSKDYQVKGSSQSPFNPFQLEVDKNQGR